MKNTEKQKRNPTPLKRQTKRKVRKQENKQPLEFHIQELQWRLRRVLVFIGLVGIGVYVYYPAIFKILVYPLKKTLTYQHMPMTMVYTSMPEAFLTKMKIVILSASLLSIPYMAWELGRFVYPALHKRERKIVYGLSVGALLLFVVGLAIAYLWIIPATWTFLMGFSMREQGDIHLEFLPRISEYMTLSVRIMLAFALACQLPVVLVLLEKLDIISQEGLKKHRRISIVAAFVVAAVITPPDPISQIILALILIGLYELAILWIGISAKDKP